MNILPGAHPISLAQKSYRRNTAVLALVAFFVLELKKGSLRNFRRVVKFCIFLFLANIGLFLFAHVNSWLTSYTIDDSSGEYVHTTDSLSTDNFRYNTGRGPRPEFMSKKREYIRVMLKKADMDVPKNLDYHNNKELNALVYKLYEERTVKSPELFGAIFYDLTNKVDKATLTAGIDKDAIEAPLQNISDEDYENLVTAMKMAQGVKLRWVGDRRRGGYLRQLMTASSPMGDDQNFHSTLEGVLYVRYGDSVQGILDEIAHPIAFHKAPYTYYLKLIYGSIRSIARAIAKLPQTAYELHQEDYHDLSTFEGEIHKVDKPRILRELKLEHLNKEAPEKPDKEHTCVMPRPLKKN